MGVKVDLWSSTTGIISFLSGVLHFNGSVTNSHGFSASEIKILKGKEQEKKWGWMNLIGSIWVN